MEETKPNPSSPGPATAGGSSIEELKNKYLSALEKAASLSREDARRMLLKELEQGLEAEKARLIHEAQEKAKAEAEAKAKDILVSAMEHAATDYTVEYTTSRIALPSDDIKGKIIGKEGRNIRTLERVTGVDYDLDEEGEIRISSFDPVRREIARIALENLIRDGRVQPAYIEQEVEKAKRQIEQDIKREGERLAMEVGLAGLPNGIIELLGRFKFRTSYGQNLAKHSLEMAKLAAYMAKEVGADVEMVKAAALFHDIGKVATEEAEGGHAILTRKILERFGFPEKLINAAASHHEDEPMQSVEAVLVYIADAISGARPGARYEDFEGYVKRITELEKIAQGFSGVKEAYAISAGREVRVIVKPEEVTDEQSAKLAHDISERIKKELTYPGFVKVVVIRESRFEETV